MNRFIVLMYHQVGDIPDKYNIPVSSFNEQLDYVQKNGYFISSIEDAELNEKVCVYTFDDGYKSDRWVADELSKRGFNATFFLVKDFLKKDSKKYLTKEEIKQMSSLGHRIGIHGKSHRWWTELSEKKLISDLKDAKYFFEDLIGREIISCSAPGGKLNDRVIDVIKDSGLFQFIRDSEPKVLNRLDNIFLINSFAIDKDMDIVEFDKLLSMNSLYLNYINTKYHFKKWIKTALNK